MNTQKTVDLRRKQSELYELQQGAIKMVKNLNFEPGQQFCQYERSLLHTLLNGMPKFDRTGTDVISVHGYQSVFNLDDGFPLVTTKKVHLKSVIYELLWFLRGDTNVKYLNDNGVTIWDEWADQNGDLGPVYGKQWVAWDDKSSKEWISFNQINKVINTIKTQHENGIISRRMIVSAWNVADIPKMKLSPCHCLFQFHSRLMTLEERKAYWAKLNQKHISWVKEMDDDLLDSVGAPIYELDLQLYQRSCDIFLGVPFNIASYALLLMMVAQVTHCKPGKFIHDYGDLHIYKNHINQVVTQLSRNPYPYPTMVLNREVKSIYDFKYEDFHLENYNHHPSLKAEVAV